MKASKVDGKYVIIAYPTITDSDYQWVQSIRQANDPQFSVVSPHITLVFASSEDIITKVEMIEHVTSSIANRKRFDFEIDKAVVARNNSDSQVHLRIGTGANEIISIHDILYDGILSRELRKDIPYVPHITVASSADKSTIQKLADTINKESRRIKGTIDRITIGLFDGESVHDMRTADLRIS